MKIKTGLKENEKWLKCILTYDQINKTNVRDLGKEDT